MVINYLSKFIELRRIVNSISRVPVTLSFLEKFLQNLVRFFHLFTLSLEIILVLIFIRVFHFGMLFLKRQQK